MSVEREQLSSPRLQLTLSNIAQLAHVQRPVVSMWRSRSRNSNRPFPPAVGLQGRQELFDAAAVTAWLVETERGNNPHAYDDAAAFAAPFGPETWRTHFSGLTALLALRCLTDQPLTPLDAGDLLDAADELDPDDEFMLSEVEALDQHLLPLAAYADLLTHATYTPAAAFEQILSDNFRTGPDVHSRTTLTSQAVQLLAATAVELAAGSLNPPVFIDDGGSDFLVSVANILGESEQGVLCVGTGTSDAARLARRRLHVHGRSNSNLDVSNTASLGQSDRTVHMAQFPSPCFPSTEPVEVLTAIDEIALSMEAKDSAVVLAPAALLTDSLERTTHNREVAAIRADVLRSDRVRAIVRLPDKLLPSMPRQAQALWVLGAAHSDAAIAERRTMVADLSATELTVDVRQDLVSDLAASMGSPADVRAHSFRFARLVPTSTLLASSGSLTTAAVVKRPHGIATPRGVSAQELVVTENLVEALSHETARPLSIKLAASTHPAAVSLSIEQALKNNMLSYLPGHRIAAEHLETDRPRQSHLRVIGTEELTGKRNRDSRGIQQLVFASAYLHGRLTEPGDIIFATGPEGGAVVDEEGVAVVLYPARILRINRKVSGGLLAHVVARDIRNVPPGPWRKWLLQRAAPQNQEALQAALQEVAGERQRLAVRLQRFDALADQLVDGVVQGRFEVMDSVVTMEGCS